MPKTANLSELTSPSTPFQTTMEEYRQSVASGIKELYRILAQHPDSPNLSKVLSFREAFDYVVTAIPSPENLGELYAQNWQAYNHKKTTKDPLIHRFTPPGKAGGHLLEEMQARARIVEYFKGGMLPQINKNAFKSIAWVAILADIWDNKSIHTPEAISKISNLSFLSDQERSKLVRTLSDSNKKIIKKALPQRREKIQVGEISTAVDIWEISAQVDESGNMGQGFNTLSKAFQYHVSKGGSFCVLDSLPIGGGKHQLTITPVGSSSALVPEEVILHGTSWIQKHMPIPESTWSFMLSSALTGLDAREQIAVCCLAPKLSTKAANKKFVSAEFTFRQELVAYLTSSYITPKIIAQFLETPENISLLVAPYTESISSTDSEESTVIEDLTYALEALAPADYEDEQLPHLLLSELAKVQGVLTDRTAAWKAMRRSSIIDPTATSLAFQIAKYTISYNQRNHDWQYAAGNEKTKVPIFSYSSLPPHQRDNLLRESCSKEAIAIFESLINLLDKNPLTTRGRSIFNALNGTSLPPHAVAIAWQSFQANACSAFNDFAEDRIPSGFADIPTYPKSLCEFKSLNAMINHFIKSNLSSPTKAYKEASKSIVEKTLFSTIPDIGPMIYDAEKFIALTKVTGLWHQINHQTASLSDVLRRKGIESVGENLSESAVNELMALATLIPPHVLEKTIAKLKPDSKHSIPLIEAQIVSKEIWSALALPGSTPYDIQAGVSSFVLQNRDALAEKATAHLEVYRMISRKLNEEYPSANLTENDSMQLLFPREETLRKSIKTVPRMAAAIGAGRYMALMAMLNNIKRPTKPSSNIIQTIWEMSTAFNGEAPPITSGPGVAEVFLPRTEQITRTSSATLKERLATFRDFCETVDIARIPPGSSSVKRESLGGTLANFFGFIKTALSPTRDTQEEPLQSYELIDQLLGNTDTSIQLPNSTAKRELFPVFPR